MKLTVLFNTDRHHPSITGGALRYFFIIRELAKLKPAWKFTVIDSKALLRNQMYERLKGVPNTEFALFSEPRSGLYPVRIILSIARTIGAGLKLGRSDVLYTDSVPALLIPALILKLFGRAKRVVVLVQLLNTGPTSWRERLYRWLLGFADTVVIINPTYRRFLRAKRIEVGSNAIADDFRPLGKEKKYDLIFIGSLEDERKGAHKFIGVAKSLFKAGKIARALIITQSDTKNIKEALQEKFLTVKQNLAQEEIIDLLNQSKLMLFPTRHESYGLVIGEALKCGVPVVTSSIEELEFWNGLIIRTNDYQFETARVLENYEEVQSRLRLLSSHPLLTKTWRDVAQDEAGLLSGQQS